MMQKPLQFLTASAVSAALVTGAASAQSLSREAIDAVVADLAGNGFTRIEIQVNRNGMDVDASGPRSRGDFEFSRIGERLSGAISTGSGAGATNTSTSFDRTSTSTSGSIATASSVASAGPNGTAVATEADSAGNATASAGGTAQFGDSEPVSAESTSTSGSGSSSAAGDFGASIAAFGN